MAIDFPGSPTNGQTFTSGSVTYTWDGTKWTAVAAGGGGATDKIEEGNTSAEVIDTGSDGRFVVTTEGTEALRVDASGRLGVGTASPTAKLEIHDGSGTAAQIVKINSGGVGLLSIQSGTTTESRIEFGDSANDDAGYIYYNNSTDYMQFGVNGAERMRITSSGEFKFTNTGSFVSATNPSNEIKFGTAAQDALTIENIASDPYSININHATSTNNSSNYYILCREVGSQRFGLRTNGGLHNYSANNVNLSDINTKKDIALSAGTWDCIKAWEIVNYRYKDQPDDADLNLGVIAQQVAESCPEVVTVFSEAKEAKPAVLDDDGNEVEAAQEAQPEKLGIKEQQMYWMAIKALQEAQVRIETLEAKVAALETP